MAEQVEKGHRTALELALEAYAEVRAEHATTQGELFGDETMNLSKIVEPLAADGTHRGRRPGVRNRRTDEVARWYIARNDGRDPLERGIEIAGLPPMAYWRDWPSALAAAAMTPPSSGPAFSARFCRSCINGRLLSSFARLARQARGSRSCGRFPTTAS